MRLLVVVLAALCLTASAWATPLVLSDFETQADFDAWVPQGHLTVCPDPCIEHTDILTLVSDNATEGAYAAKLDMWGNQDYNGMLRETWSTTDWSSYNLLTFDVVNPTENPLTVAIELDDTIHGPGWVNRHDEGFVLAPGVNHLRIWLNATMGFNANPGYLDLAHIGRLLFSVSGFTTDTTIYFDNLRLDNVPNDPYADAARNIWKFDCGTDQSPVWPDFFQLTASMHYPQEATTRPFGWVTSSGWEGKAARDWSGPDDLDRDFIFECCHTPMNFSLDVPNGDYKVWIIARGADWNGFPTESWSVTAEGVQVLSMPMDSATFYANWYFRGIHEDYPGSDTTWNVWEKPQFPSYTIATTVTDGQLNLSFTGSVGVFAFIVYPTALEDEMAARIAGYEAARTTQFDQNYLIKQPASASFTPTAEESSRGYAAWPGQMMNPCYPDTLPPDPRPALALSTFAAQGEYRSVSLALRPLAAITDVTVTASDLSDGAGHTLPSAELEAQYLRYMVTCDAGFGASALLSWKPRLLQTDFPISIAEQVSKEFWVTVHVPDGTPGGMYTGTVTVHTSAGDLSVPLSVQVYGYPLDSADEQAYGWYYMAPESEYVFSSFSDMASQADVFMHLEFADLKKHGFNSLQFPSPSVTASGGHIVGLNTAPLERYISIARAEGFGGNWVGQSFLSNLENSVSNATGYTFLSDEWNAAYREALGLFVEWMQTPAGAPLVLWLMDEPRESWAPWGDYASAMARANLANEVPGATNSITVMSGNEGSVDYTPLATALDIMQTHPWPYSGALMQMAYDQGKPNWFYNTGGDLRMVYGFYQYKYGRGNGAWEWHLNWMDSGMFDCWPYSPFNNHWRYFYPFPDGPVATLSYELASQGISDYRYLETLDRMITEANGSGDADRMGRATLAQALLTALRDDTPQFAIDNGYKTIHFDNLSSAAEAEVAMENYRRQLADMIVEMLAAQAPHTLSVTMAAPDPGTVSPGGVTALSATAQDSHPYHSVSWTWSDGGTGGTFSPAASVPNPTYTAATNATGHNVSVTLSVTGTCDGASPLSDTKTASVTVTPLPAMADFSGAPTSGTAPLAVSFTDASTNTPTAWSWSFGDGGTSTAHNPSHTYTAAGSFTVALTATNAGGGNTATRSNYITVTGGGLPAPVLTATAISATQIRLTWTDTSNLETSFRLERRTSTSQWTKLATLAADTTTYTNSGLANGVTYFYRVRAYRNGFGYSPYSNEASATTPALPPAPVLTATAISTSQIRLTWTDTTDLETGFKLERRSKGGSWLRIATLAADTTSYTDFGLTAGTSYSYRICATRSGAGDSAYSNTANATTYRLPRIPSPMHHSHGLGAGQVGAQG